jgi:hypothetical protein
MQETLTLVRPNGSEFSVDMTELRRLEGRQQLAAGAGRMEALSLLSDMKEGYQLAGEARATLGLEIDRAKTALKTRRAIVCLDIVPKGLWTARNPGGSAEQREDILNTDKEYLVLQEYIAQLEAARELMGVKMEGFRMTYSTVKRNFDDQLPGMLPKNYNGGAQIEPRPARDFLPKAAPTPGSAVPSQTAPTQVWEQTEDFGILIGKARY